MKLIKNFLIGFCIGVTVLTISIILGEIFIGNFEAAMYEELGICSIVSLFMGICIGTGITIGEKNGEKSDIEKVIILKHVLLIIFILIFVLIITLIFSIIKGFGNVINFIILLSIGALLLWIIGTILGYKTLKKDVDNINNKLKGK